MNTIGHGWKKQATILNRSSNKKNHSRRKYSRRILTTKTSDAVSTVEFERSNLDRTNQPKINNPPYAFAPPGNFTKNASKSNQFRVPISRAHRLCSTRGVVVTFIITIILIIAAGASVGIVFATINSKNAATIGGTSNNNNLNSCRVSPSFLNYS